MDSIVVVRNSYIYTSSLGNLYLIHCRVFGSVFMDNSWPLFLMQFDLFILYSTCHVHKSRKLFIIKWCKRRSPFFSITTFRLWTVCHSFPVSHNRFYTVHEWNGRHFHAACPSRPCLRCLNRRRNNERKNIVPVSYTTFPTNFTSLVFSLSFMLSLDGGGIFDLKNFTLEEDPLQSPFSPWQVPLQR